MDAYSLETSTIASIMFLIIREGLFVGTGRQDQNLPAKSYQVKIKIVHLLDSVLDLMILAVVHVGWRSDDFGILNFGGISR